MRAPVVDPRYPWGRNLLGPSGAQMSSGWSPNVGTSKTLTTGPDGLPATKITCTTAGSSVGLFTAAAIAVTPGQVWTVFAWVWSTDPITGAHVDLEGVVSGARVALTSTPQALVSTGTVPATATTSHMTVYATATAGQTFYVARAGAYLGTVDPHFWTPG